MSNALAIAAVTSTLVNLLADVDQVAGGAQVTARPPDTARDNVNGHQLNVFLYQTAPDTAWRNQEPPRSRGGESSPTRPPLALQLHYLLTAIASDGDELVAHRILGKAMSILHDNALLDRADIESALADAELHLQVERVRVTPTTLSIEEISKLWAAFQTNYRVTAAYEATVVLIDSTDPATSPLPVLRRGRTDPEGPNAVAAPGPALDAAGPDLGGAERRLGLPVRPGDRVVLTGRALGGPGTTVRFRSPRLATPVDVAALPASTADRLLADLPAGLPAGVATVAVVVERAPGETAVSNQVPVAVAPGITVDPVAATAPAFTLTLTVTPVPLTAQQPLLLFAARQVAPTTAGGGTLTFDLAGVAPGTYTVRLRVDGVDSLPIAATPPGQPPATAAFDPAQQVVVS
ncbi:MAG: DUF4255 domain-containing protein [Acidimicrobiales bacterium]